MKRLLSYSVVMFVITIILLLIIPLPAGLVDVAIILNMSLSMMILVITMTIREPLEFSIFPSLLLITTLFRLGINVSTTRNILSQGGSSGRVIAAFGDFVLRGNVVVGLIIFLIIVLMQFIVITKGAERVAEVAARFNLDAMPGKQMAIDADLSSGLINETQAKERRAKVQREADFYGAMDGATKIVKGDAVMSLITTAINLIGGSIIGIVQSGSSISAVLSTYSIATVGDGLVSQIPSMMISLSTGILVTKASKEENIGDILIGQLFSIPKVLLLVGITMLLFGIFTPLNFFFCAVYGVLFIVLSFSVKGKEEAQAIKEEVEEEEVQAEEVRRHENVNSLLQVDPIELEFGYGIIPLADVNQGGDLLDRVVMIRRQIALELGAVVPIIRLRDNIQLNPNQYIIKIKGIQVSEGEILFDHYMAMNPGYVEDEIVGIPTLEPAFHLEAMWITESQRERAESLGYTVVDPPSIIATHLTEVIKQHLDELLTRQDVQNLIDNIKDNNKTLVDELVPKLLSVGDIQKVLQNLLREGISIRDLVTIFETLADYAATSRDTDILTEYVRQSLKRAISNKYFGDGESGTVVTLDPQIEQMIMGSVKQTEQGAFISLDPAVTKSILKATEDEVKKLESKGDAPIVVTSPIVRMYFKKLTSDYLKDLIVISYNEIDSEVELKSVGVITIHDN